MATPDEWPERLWSTIERAHAEHLSYEQLEAYVDSRAAPDEVELVRAHTDLCARCASDLRDLADFAAKLKAEDAPEVEQRTGFQFARWFSIPRLAWAAGAAVILIAALVLPRERPQRAAPNGAVAKSDAGGVVEAVLPSAPALLGQTPQAPRAGRRYRVLGPDEVAAYRKELAAAPDDPRARAAVAIKFSLFSVAEQEYRALEASGGKNADDARGLLQQLQQLRGR